MKRATLRGVSAGLIVAVVFSAQGAWLSGQSRQQMWQRNRANQPKQQQPSGPPVETSGVVDAVTAGYIKLTTPTNQTWLLRVAPDAKVTVYGEAKPSALQSGAFIAFSADVDKRRSVVEDKITSLSIVTPSELRPVGAFPSQGGGFAALHNQLNPGGAGNAAPPPAGEGKGAGAATERFDIVGKYTEASRKGKASVLVPNQYFKPNLTVEIDENVVIDVELENPKAYMLAKKGDKIQAKGKQVAMTGAYVTEVMITLAEPLGVDQPERKPARAARGKRGGEDDEPEEKAAEKAPEKDAEKAPEMTADAEKDDEDGEKTVRKPKSRRSTKRSDNAAPPEEKPAAKDE